MPGPSDYNQETGELLNPEYWDGPPDLRTTKERIDDFFCPEYRSGAIQFDLNKDWLYYPPKINTREEARKMIDDRIEEAHTRLVKTFNDEDEDYISSCISESIAKHRIRERLEKLMYRFCKEGKTGRWTRYKERNKILVEEGKMSEEKAIMDHTQDYIVEFESAVKYRFKVRSNMNIDVLFDYFCVDHMGTFIMNVDMFQEKIDSGEAKVFGEKNSSIEEESLYITSVDENNYIKESRMF